MTILSTECVRKLIDSHVRDYQDWKERTGVNIRVLAGGAGVRSTDVFDVLALGSFRERHARALLMGSILVNATCRQIGVFQIKILSELMRITQR